MDTEHWEKADAIFEAALDLDPAARSGYLEKACAGDAELRGLVERLLANVGDEAETEILSETPQGPMFESFAEALAAAEALREGVVVDRYRVVREVGRGGMAEVYLAERVGDEIEQQVALKLLQRGLGGGLTRRFEQERRILAQARHPNIAQLLDVGVAPDGRPFLAMEYVEGETLDHYCDARQLGLEERLLLFIQVARAVSAAHRNLVVHRDIKPSNILVTAEGHVKLLDFGIAKLLASQDDGDLTVTHSGSRVMTPLYAAPEQIRGTPVTTATDIYQLAVLLFLLLTGRWPYRRSTRNPAELVQAICEDPPTRPSSALERGVPRDGTTRGGIPSEDDAHDEKSAEEILRDRSTTPRRLRHALRGDLDNILLKALRKEPERRYATVAQLADDLERHLDGHPVTARADTVRYRVGKFVGRHRAEVATVALALLLVIALAVFHTVEIARERDRAQLAAARATQVSELLRGLFAVSAPTRAQGEQVTARELLDRGAARLEQELVGQPEILADMSTLVGDVYRELALYEEAEPLLERAVTLRRKDAAHPLELAATLHVLARVREEEADAEAALALHEEALALREEVLGASDADVGRSLAGIGRAKVLSGDFDGARGVLERALQTLEPALGPNHPDVAEVLDNLGDVDFAVSRMDAARLHFERALSIYESRYEPLHPHIAETRVSLAEALRYTGDSTAALEVYETALEALEQIYGAGHPRVADALDKLANLLNALGSTRRAAELHRRALTIRETALGVDHPDVAASLNNLGMALWKMKQHGEARRAFERSAEVWAFQGEDHVQVTTPLRNLAGLLQDLGDLESAVPLYERVLAIREEVYGSESSRLSSPLARLGELRLDLGDPRVAEPLLRRAIALGRDQEPYRSREILRPQITLARCLTALGHDAEAEKILTAMLAEAGIADLMRFLASQPLVSLYERQGRSSEAAAIRREMAELAARNGWQVER